MVRLRMLIKNAGISSVYSIISLIVNFVARNIFLRFLNVDYLGINGLFTNIISMLSITDLGIGTAIIYKLYKPLSDGDTEAVKSIIKFYKSAFRVIAIIITFFGIIVSFFLPVLVGKITVDVNIYIVYFLFLFETISSYLLTYKRSILIADQKNYIIVLCDIFYIVVMNVLQTIILFVSKNYYLYLMIRILCRIAENIIITFIANKMYPYLCEKNIKPLDKCILNDIVVKIKGLIFHKIGYFALSGTDNIIISAFISVKAVGFYSNYLIIINALNSLIGQAINSVTSTIGNLLITEDKNYSYEIFKIFQFVCFWIYSITALMVYCGAKPFISLWLGKNYLLGDTIVAILVINYFMQGFKKNTNMFKEAAGIFHEDRFMPLIESIINIVVSIILVQYLGIIGVILGTIISSLFLYFYSYPKYTYLPLFEKKYIQYLVDYLPYMFLFIVMLILTIHFNNMINISNLYINFIVKIGSVFIIVNLIYIIIFFKTNSFKKIIKILFNSFKIFQ